MKITKEQLNKAKEVFLTEKETGGYVMAGSLPAPIKKVLGKSKLYFAFDNERDFEKHYLRLMEAREKCMDKSFSNEAKLEVMKNKYADILNLGDKKIEEVKAVSKFSVEIENFIDDFMTENFLNNENKSTKSNYKMALNSFLKYCITKEDDFKIYNIDKSFMGRYKKFSKNNYSSTSINQFLITIKMFFKHITKKKTNDYNLLEVMDDGFDKVEDIKSKNKKIKHFGTEDRQKILDYTQTLIQGKTSYDKLKKFILLQILNYSGVRVNELINIKYNDIIENPADKSQWIIKDILGKGDILRNQPISKSYLPENILKMWKQEQQLLFKNDNPFFASSKSGNQMHREQVWKMTKAVGKLLGIDATNPHGFRHSLGTYLVSEKKCNAEIGSNMLGNTPEVFRKTYMHLGEKEKTETAAIL